MIVGLGDWSDPATSDPWESQEASAWTPAALAPVNEDNPVTIDGATSTITIYPATVKPKALPRVGATKVLDKVLPKKVGNGGKVTIWGMPPAVAYALALMALSGVGYVAYRQLGGSRRLATNPRRRRRGGRTSRRSKR